MRYALALLLLAGCTSARYDSPVVAYPAERMLENREVTEHLAELVKSAGNCRRADEVAAFVVLDEGHFRLVMWPRTNLARAKQWGGSIPVGTVAIAHTHPFDCPRPSAQDRAEARRLGIPMFVVTPESTSLIGANGDVVAVRAVRVTS